MLTDIIKWLGYELICVFFQNSRMNNTSTATNSTSTEVDKKVITWCVTYAIVVVAIIINNVAAIAAFRKSRLLRKFGNFFLVNLAVADLMVGAIALPMYIHLIYNTSFGSYNSQNTKLKPFQTIQIACDVFSGMASVLTLTVISLDRVYAIYYPLRYRSLSRVPYLIVLVEVWLLSGALLGMWMLTIFDIIHRHFFAFSLAILSFASLMVMLGAYAALWLKIKLWTRHQERNLGEKERNLAAAIALVTVVFLLTWSPFHIMNILINFKASLFDGFSYQVIYFAKFLHYSNSFVNPIIYCFKISEFRRALKSLLARRKKRRETRV